MSDAFYEAYLMAVGTLNAGPGYFGMPGLNPGMLNNSAQCFVLGLPPQRDVGYVTKDSAFLLYLWNGTDDDAVLTSITGDDNADGITWDADVPLVVPSRSSLRLKITVGIDGPLEFSAILTLVSSCETIVFTVTGTRAPQLSGDVGYLFMPHNWDKGLDETLAWKTDVMISRDRTEQRVRLRTLPRRAWELRLLVAGPARRKLDTWLSLRKTRYLFAPVWRDEVRLTSAIEAGSSTVFVDDPQLLDFAEGRWLAVYDAWDNYEIRGVTGIGAGFVSVDAPFLKGWPAGTAVAPCRYGIGLESRRVSRFTEEIGDFRLTFEAKDETLMPAMASPELYRNIPVCPFVPLWADDEEDINNKWVRLDNDTGAIEFDIQSVEPVYTRDALFRIIGRAPIDTMLRFLFAAAGRLVPFWIPANDRAFELTTPSLADQAIITIESIDYDYSLKDSPARSHIEMVTTGGTIIRRKIMAVATLPSGNEQLTLDAALPVDISAANLNRCAWLELARLDTDKISLHWHGYDCVEITLPIVVLP